MGAIAASVALALGSCGPGAGGGSGIVDFQPRAGWHAEGAASVREDGRMSLLTDGRGSLVKTVTLDLDRYPVLEVRTAQSLPRLTWGVAVSPAGDRARRIVLLRRHGEEGQFIVPLRAATGWRGTMRFDLTIQLEGRRRDWIELADLQAVRLTGAAPPAPRLDLPEDRAAISAPGLHYAWFQAGNALSYDLQAARSPAFDGARTVHVVAPYLGDKVGYLPPDQALPAPGTWYWRVRGVSLEGAAGPWSGAAAFTLGPPASPAGVAAPAFSPARPLIVLQADPRRLAAQWAALPAWLTPLAALRIEAVPSESLDAAALRAAERGVPVIVQTSGPHDYYGPMASRIPLSAVERLFQRVPAVKGVYICEQAFRVGREENRVMKDYARRLISLAASYRRVVLWADGHWGRNLWIDVGLDRELMDTIRAHPTTLVPIWKMNGALAPYSAHDAAFGLWASGAVEHWGIQPERWYWYEAGLGRPGRSGWFKEGDLAAFPLSFYGSLTLLGVSGGATVYSFEPGDDLWGRGPGGAGDSGAALAPAARQIILPLLEEVVRRGLIPSREAVLGRIRTAYVADSADSPWSLDYGTLRPLYLGGYGVPYPFALMPATGRYYWIPILPRWTPASVLARFEDRLRAATLGDSAAVRRHLDARYPPAGTGSALILRVGGLVVVENSDASGGAAQSFDLPLPDGSRLAGIVGPFGYLVAAGSAIVLRRNVELPGASR